VLARQAEYRASVTFGWREALASVVACCARSSRSASVWRRGQKRFKSAGCCTGEFPGLLRRQQVRITHTDDAAEQVECPPMNFVTGARPRRPDAVDAD
jgi:hypothetical protein